MEERLTDSAHAGPYVAPADGEALMQAARKAGLKVVRVDLGAVADKPGLLAAIAAAMAFPDWFGGNWDAMEDCLTDLSWNRARGYVLLLEHCASLRKHAARDLATAVEIFESVAEFWDEQDKPFWVFIAGAGGTVSGAKQFHA